MKLLALFTTILGVATATQVYQQSSYQPSYHQQVQPIENYAQTAEHFQSAQELQQEGLYSGHSQGFGHQEDSFQGIPTGEKSARILHYNMESNDHNYQYSYETDNGIKQQEVGQTIDGTKAQGEYSYTGDDGRLYHVSYTADEHGFRAQGAHLPTPPPLPEAIAKSLEQNANDEASGIFDDGKYRSESEAEGYQQQHQQYQPQHNDFESHYQQNVGYQAPQHDNTAAQYHQYIRR